MKIGTGSKNSTTGTIRSLVKTSRLERDEKKVLSLRPSLYRFRLKIAIIKKICHTTVPGKA